MVVFPNCKINLGLNIVRKREDGYHDLETIFYPVPLCDALEINRSEENHNKLIFNNSGISVPGDISQNLCVKAYHILKKDFPQLPDGLEMHLHKTIPMGAGLGGGSSNGAFALMLLNKKFQLNIPEAQLIDYALQLGSDCPFFIVNKPCFATGRGEKMEPVSLSLSGYKLLLINPGIHISTKEAFAGIKPAPPKLSPSEAIQQPIESWKQHLLNDFETTVFPQHPAIGLLKDQLYSQGALYAAMTGTGSTVFGIFPKEYKYDNSFENQHFTKLIDL